MCERDGVATCTKCNSHFNVRGEVGTPVRCAFCQSIHVVVTFYAPEGDLPRGSPQADTKRLRRDPGAMRAAQDLIRQANTKHDEGVKRWRAEIERALRDNNRGLYATANALTAEVIQQLGALLQPLVESNTQDTVAVALTEDGRYIYACQSLSSARARWADGLPDGSHLLALSSRQLCRMDSLHVHAEPMLMFAQWLTQNPLDERGVCDTSNRPIRPFNIRAIVASQPACAHCARLQLLAGIAFDHRAAVQTGRFYHDWADPWSDGPLQLTNPFTQERSRAGDLIAQAWMEALRRGIPMSILNRIMSFTAAPPICRRPAEGPSKRRKQ